MAEPTMDQLADAYDAGYDSVPEAKGYSNYNHCLGLRAVDRAAVRRTLDEIEAFLSHGFPPDGFVSVTEMQGRLRLMRGDQ